MKLTALAAAAFLVGSPVETSPPTAPASEAEPEAPFVADAAIFADAPACIAHLAAVVRSSAPPAYDAAVGPYVIAVGDTRAHRVKAQGWGHDIEEFRCFGAKLASRRWTHSMNEVKPFTIEDIGKMSFPG